MQSKLFNFCLIARISNSDSLANFTNGITKLNKRQVDKIESPRLLIWSERKLTELIS